MDRLSLAAHCPGGHGGPPHQNFPVLERVYRAARGRRPWRARRAMDAKGGRRCAFPPYIPVKPGLTKRPLGYFLCQYPPPGCATGPPGWAAGPPGRDTGTSRGPVWGGIGSPWGAERIFWASRAICCRMFMSKRM